MNLGSLNVSIGADTTKLQQGMASAKQSLLTLAQEARISSQHLAALTAQMDKEAQATQRSASATKQAAALDRELRAAKASLTAVLSGESAAAQQVAQKYDLLTAAQRHQLTGVREQITAQKALQEATLKTAEAAERDAGRQAAAFARRPSMQQVGQGIASVGMGLTGAVTAPIIAGAAGVLAAGTQLDAALDKIRIGTGASGQQLTALEGIAKRVGVTVPNSFAEVGQAVAELAQRTGLTGPPLEALARQTLTLNRLIGGDLNETIRQNARVFADWGIAANDQGPALDMLFRTFQQTGIHVDKLAATLVDSGASLRALGFSFGEAAALVGNFEKAGVNSEQVLKSLRIELGRLAKAGITDTRQAFLQIIESIKGAGSASQATAMAVKVFGARAGPDMAAAIREGRFEIEKLWKSIAGGHDSILKAAKDTDDFGEKFAVLRNKVLIALQPLGAQLMKILGQLAEALIKAAPHLTRLAEGFAKLPGGAQLAVAGFAVFMAGLGPVLVGVGRFIAAYPAMVAGFGAIRTAMLAVNFAVLLNPITLVIAALVALTAAFVLNFGGIRDYFVTGVQVMIGMLKGLSLAEAQQAAVEASRPNAAQGEIRIGENRGSLNRVKAAQDAAAARAAAIKAAADRAAAARAAGGGFDFTQLDKQKETPAQKEQVRFTEELTQAHAKLAELLAGEDNIAAQVAARYHLLTQAQRDNLTAVLQQIKQQAELQHSQKAYTTDLGKLNAEIRRLKQGHDAEASGVDALREKYPGLSNAMLTAMNNAIQWKKHLVEMRQEAHAAAEAIRGIQLRILEAGTDNRTYEAALKLFGAKGLERGQKPKSARQFYEGLSSGQQLQAQQMGGSGPFADLDEQIKAARQQYQATVTPSGDLFSKGTREAQQRFGPGYNESLSADSVQVIANKISRLMDYQRVNEQVAAAIGAQAQATSQLNQIIGTSSFDLSKLQEQFGILTGKSAMAREVLAKFGVNLASLPKATQATVRGIIELQHRLDFFQEFAQGTQQVFENMFQNLYEHGFKGFFSSVIQGFEGMLQQMAAKYLSSKLTDLVTGLVGGFFGGGGGGDISAGSLEGMFGMAGGGSVQAAHRYMVGEQGPELFVPRSDGRIVPHGELAGAGGGTTNVTIHVSGVSDAESFRKNSGAIIGDLHRRLESRRRRDG